jgi:hypothetical protein
MSGKYSVQARLPSGANTGGAVVDDADVDSGPAIRRLGVAVRAFTTTGGPETGLALRIVGSAAAAAGLTSLSANAQQQDDGTVVVLAVGVDEPALISRLLRQLRAAADRLNRHRPAARRITLRAGFDEGLAMVSDDRFVGEVVDTVVALCAGSLTARRGEAPAGVQAVHPPAAAPSASQTSSADGESAGRMPGPALGGSAPLGPAPRRAAIGDRLARTVVAVISPRLHDDLVDYGQRAPVDGTEDADGLAWVTRPECFRPVEVDRPDGPGQPAWLVNEPEG